MMRHLLTVAAACLFAVCTGSCAAQAIALQSDADVIATERAALDRWGKGDPDGFLTTYAPEITYFDPTQEKRVDGLPALTALVAPFRGKIRVDRYDMIDPKVQRHGDIAVLTYNLISYQKQADGTERAISRWNSTAVFRRLDGRWRTIHSHWSYIKPPIQNVANRRSYVGGGWGLEGR